MTAALAVNDYLITERIEVTVEKYLSYAIDSENELPVAVRRIYLVQRDGPQSHSRHRYSIFFYASIQPRDFLFYKKKELGVFRDWLFRWPTQALM
jgi:hypothetical protein